MKHIIIIALSVLVSSTSFAGEFASKQENKGRDLSAEKIEESKEDKAEEREETTVQKRRPPYHQGVLNDR